MDGSEFSLTDLGEQLLKAAKNDTEEAIKALVKYASRNKAACAQLIELGAQQVIRNVLSRNRRPPFDEDRLEELRSKQCKPGDVSIGDIGSLRRVSKSLLKDYTLYGGMPLGMATANDLRESAVKRQKMANGLMFNARFEVSIAEKLIGNQKAKDKLSEDQVLKIYNSIR